MICWNYRSLTTKCSPKMKMINGSSFFAGKKVIYQSQKLQETRDYNAARDKTFLRCGVIKIATPSDLAFDDRENNKKN